jgi:hypothetical protein
LYRPIGVRAIPVMTGLLMGEQRPPELSMLPAAGDTAPERQ